MSIPCQIPVILWLVLWLVSTQALVPCMVSGFLRVHSLVPRPFMVPDGTNTSSGTIHGFRTAWYGGWYQHDFYCLSQ